MKFEDFLKLYYEDMNTRLREHTMRTKKIYYRPENSSVFWTETCE